MGRTGGGASWLLAAGAIAGILLSLAPAARAESIPGSSETLSLSVSKQEGVGEPVSVTVSGVADGAHRLVIEGSYLEKGEEHSPACTAFQNEGAQTLTPSGGEALQSGPFENGFVVHPKPECNYFVATRLETAGSRLPDAWASECLSFWEELSPGEWSRVSCVHPSVNYAALLAAEELGRKIVAEEEQQRNERERRAMEAERLAHEENLAREAKDEAERKAREAAARCHVPNLRGHTLSGARRLLKTAHCRLGKVTIAHHGNGMLRVSAQTPRRGRTLAYNWVVRVTLAPS